MKSYQRNVFMSLAISGLALGVIMPILTPLTRELGLADSQGGAIVSIGSVAMALSAAFWGRYSDKRGRKAGIMAGFVGILIGYIVMTALFWAGLQDILKGTVLFVLLLAARSFVGVFLPAIPSSAQALIADNTRPEERASAMALLGLGNGVGMVVGPALGGIVAMAGLLYPMGMTVILALIGLIIVSRSMPSGLAGQASQSAARLSPWGNGVWVWMLCAFLIYCAIITMQVSAGFFLQDRLGVSGSTAAQVLAIALTMVGVMLIITQILQMKLLQWGPRRLGVVGGLTFAGAILLLLVSHSALMCYLAYGIMGLGAGMLVTCVSSGSSMAVGPDQQGQVGGLVAVAQGVAAIIAPYGSTVLYEQAMDRPFVVAAAGLALVAVIQAVVPVRVASNASAPKL